MRDILSVALCEGEEHAQPGEFTEGDDDWLKPKNSGRETLEQRLALTIAESTSINTTAGTEQTEWIELETFPKNIASFANNKEE